MHTRVVCIVFILSSSAPCIATVVQEVCSMHIVSKVLASIMHNMHTIYICTYYAYYSRVVCKVLCILLSTRVLILL
jgi:hypothetical protein